MPLIFNGVMLVVQVLTKMGIRIHINSWMPW